MSDKPMSAGSGGMGEEEWAAYREILLTARDWMDADFGDEWGIKIVATLDALRAERDALADARHADEKHELSQSPAEFLMARNRKRRCDSDGFIACERCQTMSVCLTVGDLKKRSSRADELLNAVLSHLHPGCKNGCLGADIKKHLDAHRKGGS